MSTDIKQQLVDELHKAARKTFARRRVEIRGYDDLWQADLIEMRPYADENKGHNYILAVIDTYSKYGWARPLMTKNAADVTSAMASILEKSQRTPRNLQTDDGKEFYNSKFQGLMKQHKINHYSTFTHLKASIVERWNRTIKNKMWKRFSYQGSHKWLDILDGLVTEYNNTKHRTIDMKPTDVKKATVIPAYNQIDANIHTVMRQKPKFKVNDQVRISKYKHLFQKGYTPSWSTEIFKVIKVNRDTIPVTYYLQDFQGVDIQGVFYEQELQRTLHPDVFLVEKVLKKRGPKVYVKWLGFSDDHNSWINASDIV